MLVAHSHVEGQRLLERLAHARKETDKLFELVRTAFLYARPIPERHRIIFYLGHLEAFDWNLLRTRALDSKPVDPSLDRLFAFGIDPVGGGLPSDQPSDWPSETEVRSYCARIRRVLDTGLGSGGDSAAPLLNVAIEHRLMHAETLAYMLHQLPLEGKVPQAQAAVADSEIAASQAVEIPEGSATLGISSNDTGAFGWDNEYEAQNIDVPAFEMDRYKVSNGDFLRFVEAGGYTKKIWWSPADWEWRTAHGIAQPIFWTRADGRWHLRTMFDQIPLPLNWPVYASHAEASAYARWAGKRLPTEAEWHRAAYGTPEGGERQFPWGNQAPGPTHGYFEMQRWDPVAVNASPGGRSAFGLDGLLGNGWEWTSSPFEPFPGFHPFSFYPGYSADFFDGKHYVMKGGSQRTEACMLRRSFRNWFQPHYQYVYAGFRCVSR